MSYELGNKSDMKRFMKDLEKEVIKDIESQLKNYRCPSCGHRFSAEIGENVCPSCHQEITIS